METKHRKMILIIIIMFKSYYVVWKPTYTLPGSNEADEV